MCGSCYAPWGCWAQRSLEGRALLPVGQAVRASLTSLSWAQPGPGTSREASECPVQEGGMWELLSPSGWSGHPPHDPNGLAFILVRVPHRARVGPGADAGTQRALLPGPRLQKIQKAKGKSERGGPPQGALSSQSQRGVLAAPSLVFWRNATGPSRGPGNQAGSPLGACRGGNACHPRPRPPGADHEDSPVRMEKWALISDPALTAAGQPPARALAVLQLICKSADIPWGHVCKA